MDASIIVPTFNEGRYLKMCLSSLRNQDFDGTYEIIVSDSYSNDETVKIAEKYADRVVLSKKYTIAYGRQAGAEVAKGKILVFTDADVVAPHDWLKQIISNFKDEKVVGVHGLIIPYGGKKYEKIFCERFFPPYSSMMVRLKHPSPPGSNMAVRKSAFDAVGGFNVDTVTCEDVILADKLKRVGRFKFDKKSVNYVSVRRLRAWGYKKYINYYAKNTVLIHLLNKSKDDYEHIE